jgi:hypothetical protein
VAVSLIPIAIGVAVLKYRLYDIDRVINRTLVYGLLTVLLGAIYAAGVFAIGRVLDPADGQSELAVAASTLAVAALFQPARRRIQQTVDRRYNRRKYNAVKTVEAFSARLRDEIDLDTLSSELLALVDETVQPTRSSLLASANRPRITAYGSLNNSSPVAPGVWKRVGGPADLGRHSHRPAHQGRNGDRGETVVVRSTSMDAIRARERPWPAITWPPLGVVAIGRRCGCCWPPATAPAGPRSRRQSAQGADRGGVGRPRSSALSFAGSPHGCWRCPGWD